MHDRFIKAGLIDKVEQTVKERRSKVFYVASSDRENGKTVTIEMRKLFEATQEWFTKHDVNGEYSNSKDSKVYSGTHTFFKKTRIAVFRVY
jgi:predicted transcriptional regulator